MNGIFAVILAGGSSQRMKADKMLLNLYGKTPVEHSIDSLLYSSYPPEKIVISASEKCIGMFRSLQRDNCEIIVVNGGNTRCQSAINALNALKGCRGIVSINDAARCAVSPYVIDRSIESAIKFSCGVAAITVRDTLRYNSGESVPRDELYAIQTPQSFDLERITAAYEQAAAAGLEFTDDLGVWMFAGNKAVYSSGDISNQKLTYPEDIKLFDCLMKGNKMKVGLGEDTHRLMPDRSLIIGGVKIPYHVGLMGHSDADVLVHAIMDALLGAAALGDIGTHFPDTNDEYKDISSLKLLEKVGKLIKSGGYFIGNIDAVITAQAPKLSPYISNMRENIAKALGCENDLISIKATTPEYMNDEGQGRCITARAVCIINDCKSRFNCD